MDDAKRKTAALETWKRYRRWATTSAELKRGQDRWKRVVFWLGIVGLVLGPVAAGDATLGAAPAWLLRGIATVSGLAVAFAAYFRENVLGPAPDAGWMKARQGAEGLKSLTFTFLMGAPPFEGDDPAKVFHAELQRIEDELQQASLAPANLDPEAASKGFPELPMSSEAYLAVRLEEQRAWFEKKVEENHEAAKRLERAKKVLGGLAVGLGVFTAATPGLAGWIAVITVVVAALGAQLTAGGYQLLQKSYSATAARLGRIAVRWQLSGQSEQDARRLVSDCETALREENAAWVEAMLSRGGKPPPEPAPSAAGTVAATR
jgi:uncharacterized membrane protein HdeD (DUF308 family)